MAKRIVVVGDLFLDRFHQGYLNRMSGEAPIPVVDSNGVIETPGGAGNVAMNLASLGCQVDLVCFVGRDDDEATVVLKETFEEIDKITVHMIKMSRNKVTIKNRICDTRGVQIARYDQRDLRVGYTDEAYEELENITRKLLRSGPKDQRKCLVLSDYGLGALSNSDCTKNILKDAADLNIPSIVDPRGTDFERYAQATLIVPNVREAEIALGVRDNLAPDNLDAGEEYALQLANKLSASGVRAVAVTASELGIYLAVPIQTPEGMTVKVSRIPAYPPREVCDPSGAGDTVVACVADRLVCAADDYNWVTQLLPDALRRASIGAGIVVSQAMVATLSKPEYESALADNFLIPQNKVTDIDSAAVFVQAVRNDGNTIAMVCGCFDMLHPGHLKLLLEARKRADHLVVAINEDKYLMEKKGRVLWPLEQRCAMLSALACVDLIIPFSSDTAEDVVDAIGPDVFVKDEEYKNKLPEQEAVERNGGRVVFIKKLTGYSTTNMLDALRG